MTEEDTSTRNNAFAILGEAAIYLLKHNLRATPQLMYALILSWEETALPSLKKDCSVALKFLQKKLN